MESGRWMLGSSLISGLDCVSFVVSLSPPIGVTNCESCLSLLGSKVTDSDGAEMIWISLIWREEGKDALIRGVQYIIY